MMTLYLLFDALRAGKIAMQTQMPVSVHAEQQKPTKLSLRHGQTIDVDTAIRALVIRSANDAAVVIAEALGGTESHFAEMMNAKAKELGMKETNYHNASGLPDPLQITTASDLAVLARHLAYDFPEYFPYFGTSGFTYKGLYYPTHDNLVGRYRGADGIKTGYVGASGFNLATSVVRDGVHLIGIVMGGRTAVRRDVEMMHLMDTEFATIKTNPSLVARGPVPWHDNIVLASAAPSGGFATPPVPGNPQFASLSAVPPPLPADADEDSAESHRAPDENYTALQAEVPALAGAAVPTEPVPDPASRQVAAAEVPGAQQSLPSQQMMMSASGMSASATPQFETPVPTSLHGRAWAIQVGVFGNQNMAEAQLKKYAAMATDLIGQAAHIVAPIQSASGHTLYRARFGPYGEREAHQVCSRLTQRGQSCFPVVAR
jgi:D-alanyl-D-alanine carboxypeptidase